MKKVLILTAVVLGLAMTTQADVIETLQEGVDGYAGTSDTWLYSTNTQKGSSSVLAVQQAGSDVLIKFDLSGLDTSIAGKTINSATLSLAGIWWASTTAYNYTYHRMLRNWDEATADADDATSSTTWQTAKARGANDRAASSGTLSYGSGSTTIDITSIVQAWADGSANYGLKLECVNTSANDAKQFGSSENATIANHPRLNINYTPEPATMSLLGIGGLLALVRKRR